MKKLLFIAGAVVAMVACNKAESSVSITNPEEIGFMTMTQNATRGYVPYNAFKEVANPDTTGHNTSLISQTYLYRDMIVSAYNKTDNEDYFQKATFTKGGTTNIWHANPVLYWPIGKDLQFLAYSSKNITVSSDARPEPVANWDGTKKVSFNITPLQCYQNDILYAQASGSNRGTQYTGRTANGSNSKNGLAIQFFHAQAWLTFNIKFKGEDSTTFYNASTNPNGLKIKSIVLKNVYNQGVLSIEYNDAVETTLPKPTAKWDFFTQCQTDVTVDDPWNALDPTKLKATEKDGAHNGIQLNMLMPEQKHDKFVINYELNGEENSITLPFKDGSFNDTTASGTPADEAPEGNNSTGDLVDGMWVMGAHYIYNINFSINEITFAPTVTVWTEVTGFNPNPQNL